MPDEEYELFENKDAEELTEEEAFAFQVKKLYDALKAEGFNSGWAGDFVKQFFAGTAGGK